MLGERSKKIGARDLPDKPPLAHHGKSPISTLEKDLGEYLQEELRLLPVRIEIDAFLAAVDSLRDDSERLQARFDRLRAIARHSGSEKA